MKNWYLLVVWFDDRALAMAIERASTPQKALENRPYNWSDFVEPRGPLVVRVYSLETLALTKELIINAVSTAENAG